MNLSVDGLLIYSFGGPEGPADVMPFLKNVTAGRNVPQERLEQVAEQYALFDGVSPINSQNRSLKTMVQSELVARGHNTVVYLANRNWNPYLPETLHQMTADGIESVAVFVTSGFGSYSGCRQYIEELSQAALTLGSKAPKLHKLRLFYNHPGFIKPLAKNLHELIDPEIDATITFSAHSIPMTMANSCPYQSQLQQAARLVLTETASLLPTRLNTDHTEPVLVYQSRSGPPHIPWLEPDINDHLATMADAGVNRIIVVPLGFISDHMEVIYDLDTLAAQTAERLSIEFLRVPTVGLAQEFVTMIVQLLEERFGDPAAQRLWLGESGPWGDHCPPDHCPISSSL